MAQFREKIDPEKQLESIESLIKELMSDGYDQKSIRKLMEKSHLQYEKGFKDQVCSILEELEVIK